MKSFLSNTKLYFKTLNLINFIYAAKAKITNVKKEVKVVRADVKAHFYLRVPSSDFSTFKQIFLENEYMFDMENEPKVIVDAGANIGLAAIYFSNKYPAAKIIAIEPEYENYKLMKKNVEPHDNIMPLQAALWDKNEKINLVDPGLGEWGFMTEQKGSFMGPFGPTSHSVNAITIDKIIDDYELDKINILKIDVEGAEKEIFSDSSLWLSKCDSIIIELHEHVKSGCNRSFYNGSNGFDNEWMQGENIYLSKTGWLIKSRFH